MAKREFIFSIDVEALPGRAESDHVRKLIWGDFQDTDDPELGIREMAEDGDRYDIPLTFYLDFAERYHHSADEIDSAARFISQSGHDLQLHIHPEMLPVSFWEERGMERPTGRRFHYADSYCKAVMEQMVADMTMVTGQKPIAYRAGAFQANQGWLDAAKAQGITVSSNFCYASFVNQDRIPWSEPQQSVYGWDCGLAELPVSQLHVEDRWRTFAMPMPGLRKSRVREYLEILADRPREDGPAVLLLHSWSFLKYAGGGQRAFVGTNSWKRDLLRTIMETARELFEPISTVEFAQRFSAGAYSPVRTMPTSAANERIKA